MGFSAFCISHRCLLNMKVFITSVLLEALIVFVRSLHFFLFPCEKIAVLLIVMLKDTLLLNACESSESDAL